MRDLSIYACQDQDAKRLIEEESDEFRTPFFRDIDRIIYSLSYLRYADKTQVFSFNENDHITKRMVHVQLVSKIARTIGRNLALNEDLIEAAALGHDLGHVPFGHTGERILNEISLKNNEGYFNHNIQSVRTLMYLEQNGKGRNLTIQVLDAIMCHNGELPRQEYSPKPKTPQEFLEEYQLSYQDPSIIKKLRPSTLEGCVVRISDIIAYIGKDIEDAQMLGIIKTEDIPQDITNVLGTTNKDIINTIVKDIITNSKDQNYLKLSDNVYNALIKLKDFNYENIYQKANTKEEVKLFEDMFNTLFETYLNDIKNNNYNSAIYQVFLKDMNQEYLANTSSARKVIDFLAGMTDDYMKNCFLNLKK